MELTAVTEGAPAFGKQVDCTTDKCAVTVFHDHRNGFDTVSEKPITVNAAPATSSGAPAVATDNTTATSSMDSATPNGWFIGLALVLPQRTVSHGG